MTPGTEELPTEMGALAEKLTEAQRALIAHMSDGEMVYPLPRIAETVPLVIAEARKAVCGLRGMGLAQYGPLRDQDDGRPKGSGTWLTPLGLALRAHLQANPIPNSDSKEEGR